MGERTGSRVFQWVWSYVLEIRQMGGYIGMVSASVMDNELCGPR
ncbi:hypothetical protein CTRU02_206285 [Colletotrichum truncatum]|uniref:Uncharacterized protein n=1 Tax=Colletotrichum truncatum TaxID=5467 RepID=A0ACC3Z6Q8_COLTU